MQIAPVKLNLCRIVRMEKAVRLAERRIAPPDQLVGLGPDDYVCFHSSAPNISSYGPSSAFNFLRVLKMIEPALDRDQTFADLGSGLGAITFAASTYFRQAVGFELDPRLIAGAEAVRQAEGFDNVSFIFQDITKTDLGRFGCLYLYQPFIDNFTELMAPQLAKTRPGTVIVANIFSFFLEGLFPEQHFRQLVNADNQMIEFSAYRVFQRL
jgi:hypothetical protein